MFKTLYIKFVASCTPSCKEVARLASESMERKLTFFERLRMKLHYGICYWCQRYDDQVHIIHEAVHEHGDEISECCGDANANLSEDCKARLKALCKSEGTSENQG